MYVIYMKEKKLKPSLKNIFMNYLIILSLVRVLKV